jgi:hypothetical protein
MNLSSIFQPVFRPPPPPAAIPSRPPARQAPAAAPRQTPAQHARNVDSFQRSATTPGTRELAQKLNPAGNPKYLKHDGNTYCNVYTQDFMKARGVTLPQKTANDTSAWLHSDAGKKAGWRQATAAEAQAAVNAGGNALVTSTHNPHGHIAPVVEGRLNADGSPNISNAGSKNFNIGPATDSPAFRRPNTEYWIHD